jgi:hypothetical protein
VSYLRDFNMPAFWNMPMLTVCKGKSQRSNLYGKENAASHGRRFVMRAKALP